MFKKRSAILVALIVVMAFAQTRILLYDFEPRGVDVSVIRTTTQLLRDALNGTYKYVVIDPPVGTSCYNVVAAADSAKAYSAEQALVGNIMSIGGRQWLTFQLVDASAGTVAWQGKLEMPAASDFPLMADRIAASIVDRKPIEETIEPEKTISSEVEPRFRHARKPYAGLFLTGGYVFLLKDRPRINNDPDYFGNKLANLGLSVSFEAQQLLTLLEVGLLRGRNKEYDVEFNLLGNYVLGKGDFAPFVGGGLGITKFKWEDQNGESRGSDALAVSAGLGLLGLRTYYFRLVAAAYASYLLVAEPWGEGVSGGEELPTLKVLFGVTTPTLGPEGTIKASPACVGTVIGGFFLTGLVIALTS